MPNTRTMIETPLGCFKGGDTQTFGYTFQQIPNPEETNPTRAMFDASLNSNLYKNGLTEVNVNGIFGLMLIRSH